MTDINHRRKNKLPKNQRHKHFHNGYGCMLEEAEERGVTSALKRKRGQISRVGNTDQLDKSLHSWGRLSTFSDKSIGSRVGNDFANGHKGMAKSVKGVKKFVRTRIRFHEKATLKKMLKEDY